MNRSASDDSRPVSRGWSRTTNPHLHRTTINLTQKAHDALERLGLRNPDDNRTVLINRAVLLAELLDNVWATGGEVTIRREDGREEVLRLL